MNLRPSGFAFSVLAYSSLAAAAAPQSSMFVREDVPLASIYHDGWIDLNKNGRKDAYEDRSLPVDQRIDDLLAQMTLEEKTAQMVTLYGYPRILKDELPTPAWNTSMWKDGIGNIDEQANGNMGEHGDLPDPVHDLPWSLHVREINEIQRWFVQETRLGVPVDFTNEGIRGLLHSKATSFPAELAVAAAWNRELVRGIGRVTGREARALGYTNVYSPVIDVARDPRWGRIIESYGEDPFLDGELAMEQVRGIQEQQVVATVKHFAIYGIPKGGRDGDARTDPHATWSEVQTVLLVPFRKAIRDAGALGVMASYNDYDGVPIAASRLFLTDILRGEYGFHGYVVSDSGAVEFIHDKHHVAPTYPEAIRLAVEAGVNVRTHFTPPQDYVEPLRQLVRDGRLSMATIDARVRDILRVKFWQGSFDSPYKDPEIATHVVRSSESLALAAKVARESIILLKNESNALPLRKDIKRVLIAGPLADDPHAWWSRYGPQRIDVITPLAGIRAKLGPDVEVRYANGVEAKDTDFPESDVLKEPPSAEVRAGIDAAVAAARGVDVIVACLGETDELCRESASRVSLNLPGYQEELLEALHATGVPVVLVLSNGRPLSVNWAAKHVPSIVEMFFAGEQGGAALADVLFGDYNPAGRLPVTFPRTVGQIPFNFPAKPGSQDRDPGQVSGPLYPFGHGLSYTTFSYANLHVSPESISLAGLDAVGPGSTTPATAVGPGSTTPATAVTISVDVTNSGSRAGDEVVQLYLRDDYSTVTTPVKSLRGFLRIALAPGETRTVSFPLTRESLQLFNAERKWVVEPGRFTVMIGASSADIRQRGSLEVTRIDGTAPEEDPIVDP